MIVVNTPSVVCPATTESDTGAAILSVSSSGSWIVRLPPVLRDQQSELESLLLKVFADRPRSDENVALARQMSLNWCVSKCKKSGLSFEETLGY